jgi:hypothetical protein
MVRRMAWHTRARGRPRGTASSTLEANPAAVHLSSPRFRTTLIRSMNIGEIRRYSSGHGQKSSPIGHDADLRGQAFRVERTRSSGCRGIALPQADAA